MPNLERYLVAAIVAIVLLILGLTIFGNLDPEPGSVAPGANSLATPLEPPGPRTGTSPLESGVRGNGRRGKESQARQDAGGRAPGAGGPARAVSVALNASQHPQGPAGPRGIGSGSPIPYEAHAGDTFASIARTFYGTAKLGSEIRKMNEDLDPFDIAPGTRVYVPMLPRKDVLAMLGPRAGAGAPPAGAVAEGGGVTDAPGASRAEAAPAPATRTAGAAGVLPTYEVKPGDTLSQISQKLYGTSKRWKEILELNKDLFEEPRDMQVGMKIKLLPLETARGG